MASSDQTALQFSASSASLSAKVHPLVIFNICDCFVRRPDQAERIIGTLLGSVLPDGTVDVRNCYAVPHSESQDQVCLSLLQILLILVRFRLILLEWIGNELYFVCNSFSLFEWFLCNFWLARVIFSQFFEVRECYCCLYYFIDKIWLIRVHIVFVHGNCVHANTEWKYIEKGIYFVGM